MANTRTGRSRGYRGQKGGSHTLPWRQDPIILQRLEVGAQPWLEKRSDQYCLNAVNDWCASIGEPSIEMQTLKTDRERWRELLTERPKITAEQLEAELDRVIAVAYQKLGTATANNPGSFLSTARQAIMDKAKLHQMGGEGQQDATTLLAVILGELAGEKPETEKRSLPG